MQFLIPISPQTWQWRTQKADFDPDQSSGAAVEDSNAVFDPDQSSDMAVEDPKCEF